MEETALYGRNSFNVKGGSHTVHKALKNSLELRKDVFQSKGKRKRSKAGKGLTDSTVLP